MTGNLLFLGIGLSTMMGGDGENANDELLEHTYFNPLHPAYYALAILSNGIGALVGWYIMARADAASQTNGSSSSSSSSTKPRRLWQRETYQVAAFCSLMIIIGVTVYQVTHTVVGMMFLAASFGAQQVYTSTTPELGCSVIFMTGNMHALSSTVSNAILGKLQWSRNKADVIIKDCTPFIMICSVLCGAIVGGLFTNHDCRGCDMSRSVIIPIQLMLFIMTEHILIGRS